MTDESRTWWIDSGPEDLGDGIHRIPLPLPTDALRAVNVYVIENGEDLVLVDGGWALPESEQVLRRGLAKLGYDPRDITDFLVTHIHRDHYTQAVALRAEARVTGSASRSRDVAPALQPSNCASPL